MIREIELTNFKCFQRQQINFHNPASHMCVLQMDIAFTLA